MKSRLISQKIILLAYLFLLAVFGWWASSWPMLLLPGALLLFVLTVLVVKLLSGLSWVTIDFYKHLIVPQLFLLAAVLFYIFFNTLFLQKIYWGLVCLAMYFYLYNLWLFYKKPKLYQAFTLENYSWYLHLAASFLFTSSIFGLVIFISFTWYLAIISVLLFAGLVFIQMWWIQRLNNTDQWWWLLTHLFICLAALVSMMLLPFSFYVLGFWWTAIWFLSTTFIFQHVTGKYIWRKYLWQAGLIFVIALLITYSAKIF